MVDATTTDKAASSPESTPAGMNADKTAASQTRPPGKPDFASARLAAAATIDDLLAKEALANLKRSRAAAHADTVKSKARILVPPATLVVKPPQTQAWMTPFITL